MRALPLPVRKFFADRGPHLAAMIAYFALLSFVPLLFLTVSLLALAGRPDESSYLVEELKRAFPGSSVSSIVDTVTAIQKHATALGILGGAALLWPRVRNRRYGNSLVFVGDHLLSRPVRQGASP